MSNRKFQHYWLTMHFSALRVGEYKYMSASITDDDTDVSNPGGFTGSVQQYGYGRLYNLYLDPKESRSYMIRKLVYIDAMLAEIARHRRTFREWVKQAPIDQCLRASTMVGIAAGVLVPLCVRARSSRSGFQHVPTRRLRMRSRSRFIKSATTIAAASALVVAGFASAAYPHGSHGDGDSHHGHHRGHDSGPSAPVVLTNGLNNPRQLSLVDGKVLLIAEAGAGGTDLPGHRRGHDVHRRDRFGQRRAVPAAREPIAATRSSSPA